MDNGCDKRWSNARALASLWYSPCCSYYDASSDFAAQPKDSEHPDRSANISVFVETWLSEEQYQEAKERQELAWQESPRQTTAEPETPGDVEVSLTYTQRTGR